MEYISTRGQAPILDFENAMLVGLAEDGGLYVPRDYPRLDAATIEGFADSAYNKTAFAVLAPFIGDFLAPDRLRELIAESYACFDSDEVAPLTALGGRHYMLELFHGPTFAFKDIAMQLLARLMDEALTRRQRRATIIAATSGDTGGAGIEAFRNCDMIDIFILYPHGRVSDVQRKQMTVPQNAQCHALAIDGTFDDCQNLVKAMFGDMDFRARVGLAGVNSINWARVMAQVVYYFTASAKLTGGKEPVGFSVPTGNFGDIFAGFIAAKMGLPIAELMIATNVNDILARVLQSGVYQIGEVVATSSPSMDIQVASNFERLLFEASGRDASCVRGLMDELTAQHSFTLPPAMHQKIRAEFSAQRIDEVEVAKTMRTLLEEKGLLIDPHSAVGISAAYRSELDAAIPIVSLATAHPAKFPDAVQQATGATPPVPPRIAQMMSQPERGHTMACDVAQIKAYIDEHRRQ